MRTVVGVASGLLSLKQFANGTVLIGGGWQGIGDPERGGAEIIPDNLIGNLRLARYAIPTLSGGRIVRAWLGSGPAWLFAGLFLFAPSTLVRNGLLGLGFASLVVGFAIMRSRPAAGAVLAVGCQNFQPADHRLLFQLSFRHGQERAHDNSSANYGSLCLCGRSQ